MSRAPVRLTFFRPTPLATTGCFLLPAAFSAVLLCALGCANPGPPRPPSLRLPEPVKDLRAERVGDQVRLTWTNPTRTTDGDPIRGAITPVLCRETSRSTAKAPAGLLPRPVPCSILQRLPALLPAAGDARASDPLPPPLVAGDPSLLVYRIEILNAQGRSAAPSAPAFAAAGAAPPPLAAIQASLRREGILITWAPTPPSPALVELHRTLLSTAAGPVSPELSAHAVAAHPPDKGRAGAAVASSQSSSPPPALSRNKPAATELILTAEGSATTPTTPTQPDPGGLIDRSVRDLDRVSYVAQRVRIVHLAGQALELRGLPSPPVSFTFRAILPPQPPAGLVSIPGGGFGEPLSIDLSWEPGAEPDLLGYNIYRSDASAPGASFHRLNPQPIPVPAFRDLTVQPGSAYRYVVTALDQHGNESRRSSEIREAIRK